MSDQLTGSFSVSAADLAALLNGEAEAPQSVTVLSEDEATSFTFNADGTYRFFFEDYDVEDLGTWTYENGVLTITDANGAATTAEGDPLSFVYAYSMSDQLTGSFSVSASDLSFDSDGVTILSDDGATAMIFRADGTYVFVFEAYDIEDPGTWTYENGKLTVTNANGDTVEAQGDPLTVHYVSAVSEQLTGDFTISSSELPE